MDRLRTLVAQHQSEDPEALADLLLESLTGDIPQDDDVALLCVRTADPVDPLTTSIPADPGALAELRTVVRDWLAARRLPADVYDDVILVCDEACANAIEHAYRREPAEPIGVEVALEGNDISITVRDAGSWRDDPIGEGRGRGIAIMRALMDDVDIRSTEEGTVVRLRRHLPADGDPAAPTDT
jgi:anti-sigma regulatory factor (Ser/Thr protein kinase)